MKNQSKFTVIAISALFLIILGGFNQKIQAQSGNEVKEVGKNFKLADEIKSILKTKENKLNLEKEAIYNNNFSLRFKLKKKDVFVVVNELDTVQQAIERFKDAGDPSRVSVPVPVKLERNFADQAMLRITNLQGGSAINYYFRQGLYTVSIWGEEK